MLIFRKSCFLIKMGNLVRSLSNSMKIMTVRLIDDSADVD